MKKLKLIFMHLTICLLLYGCGTQTEQETTTYCRHDNVSNYKTIKKATCIAQGIEKGVCEDCGYEYTRGIDLDSSAHQYEKVQIKEKATNQICGKKVKECKLCGKKYKFLYNKSLIESNEVIIKKHIDSKDKISYSIQVYMDNLITCKGILFAFSDFIIECNIENWDYSIIFSYKNKNNDIFFISSNLGQLYSKNNKAVMYNSSDMELETFINNFFGEKKLNDNIFILIQENINNLLNTF